MPYIVLYPRFSIVLPMSSFEKFIVRYWYPRWKFSFVSSYESFTYLRSSFLVSLIMTSISMIPSWFVKKNNLYMIEFYFSLLYAERIFFSFNSGNFSKTYRYTSAECGSVFKFMSFSSFFFSKNCCCSNEGEFLIRSW